MGHCPSITTALPIKPLPKCSQAGALQTKLFVLSRPTSAPASRSISPNCLQIAKAELPPKSCHAMPWLESRLSLALQMLGDEKCWCVTASRAFCYKLQGKQLWNSAVPHQHQEQQPVEQGRYSIPALGLVLLLSPAGAGFRQRPGKCVFKLRPRFEGAASWEGQERMERLPWGIWLFTLYYVACGHCPVLHILSQGGDWQPPLLTPRL